MEEFLKTQNIDIEERELLLKLETNKKKKLNIRIDNIALDQIIKDIKPKDITTLNELTYSTAKVIMKKHGMKKKNKNGTSHKKQLGNVKFRKKLKLLRVNYLYWKIYQKGSM